MSGVRFTAAEDEFLRENIERYTYDELARAITERFGTYRNLNAVSDRCTKRLKICRGCNTGQFKQGRRDRHKIGDEVESNGYVYVKVADIYFPEDTAPTGYCLPNWMPKQRFVWEIATGMTVPNDSVVIFLNNDKSDFRPENLCCISRKVSVRMAQNNWFSTDPIITATAIKWCELFYAIKDARVG